MKKSEKRRIADEDEIIKIRSEIVKLVDLEDKIRWHDSEIKSWDHWIKKNGLELERLESERLRLSLLIEKQKKELHKNKIKKKNLKNKVPKHGGGVQEMLKKIKALRKCGIKSKNNIIYCLKCKKITKHDAYGYQSSPLGGIGAEMSYNEGLRCSKCGNELSRFDLGRMGL